MTFVKVVRESLYMLPLYSGTALVLWLLVRIVYLRYFHPLANIPGPYLASVTELYRFYYDYIKNGSFYLKFEAFEAKYGEKE
jgi:hypothetical protein